MPQSQTGRHCFLFVDAKHPYSPPFGGTCSSSFLPSSSNPWFPWKPPSSYKAALLIRTWISPEMGTFPAEPFKTLPWAVLTTKQRLSTPLVHRNPTMGNENHHGFLPHGEVKSSVKENEGNPQEEPRRVMQRERGRRRRRETLQNPGGLDISHWLLAQMHLYHLCFFNP